MLTLQGTYKLDDVIDLPNIVDKLEDADRQAIGTWVNEGYMADKSSRAEWEEAMANAMKLTLQVAENKSEPWAGASNVKFPLVTIAALQFHARVYPILVPGPEIAKCKVIGTGNQDQIARATRLATHMSWQLLEQDVAWEGMHDKALLVVAIMGDAFKKSYFDASEKYPTGELVLPQDLVVNYWTKTTIDMSPRATHVRKFSRNEVVERERRGTFAEGSYGSNTAPMPDDPLTAARNEREGTQPPAMDSTTLLTFYEQLCWIDLDGDGYAEPYIATVEDGGCLRRLVARFNPSGIERNKAKEVVRIAPIAMYNRYSLIPAPDGGFYSLGFGRLLGPINDSINTALNQLFDAGTLSNYGGGFLGRGARFRGGQYTFKPQEWKQVDSPGDDLRKNIVPLPVREPSDVLFKLLGFLVNYGERIASANDLQVGENIGQNTPAETARTMNANGQRVLAAMYKRMWRAFRDELRTRFTLNKTYLEVSADFDELVRGPTPMLQADDYRAAGLYIVPAADPTMVDDVSKIAGAAEVMGMAYKLPNFNKYFATRKWLEARRVQDIDTLYPQPPMPEGAPPGTVPDVQSPPDPKMLEIQIKQGEFQLEQQRFKLEQQKEQVQLMLDVQEDQRALQEMRASIGLMQAQAAKAYAEAKGVETGHMVGILQTQQAQMENIIRMMELEANKIDNRVKERLGRMKIIEATVKTTGAIDNERVKAAKRRATEGQRAEASVAEPPIDQAVAGAAEGLGNGNVPLLG